MGFLLILLVRVYPRACGGAVQPEDFVRHNWGLSPRVRGSQAAIPVAAARFGSIPARAGEPVSNRRSVRAIWVYPRACGGAA